MVEAGINTAVFKSHSTRAAAHHGDCSILLVDLLRKEKDPGF